MLKKIILLFLLLVLVFSVGASQVKQDVATGTNYVIIEGQTRELVPSEFFNYVINNSNGDVVECGYYDLSPLAVYDLSLFRSEGKGLICDDMKVNYVSDKYGKLEKRLVPNLNSQTFTVVELNEKVKELEQRIGELEIVKAKELNINTSTEPEEKPNNLIYLFIGLIMAIGGIAYWISKNGSKAV